MNAIKTCPNCQAEVIDNLQLCWNCNYSFSERKVVMQSLKNKYSNSRIKYIFVQTNLLNYETGHKFGYKKRVL